MWASWKSQIVDQKFAEEIAPSAGLRNRLVYEYEEIDDKIVYKNIQKTINSYQKYIRKIENHLKNIENSSR
ncbi:HepT-like ribonuclease domain-containing protein [Halanaerobium kushneri]|uniref:HepT-like ribonuclease domain-containing protein n=1 Tax=Halanaerobium kushneri TaxID=56779 RepID=UPI000A07B29E